MSNILEEILNKNSEKHKYVLAGKRLNKTFNGVKRGDYVLVTGVASSGKRSFVDNYYVIGLLRQWYMLDDVGRADRPLKIIYFSTKYTEEFKLMKWTANRYTSANSRIMDIPTMTGSAGKLFMIDESRKKKLYSEFKLFEEAADAGVLEIVDRSITTLTIEKKMTHVLDSMGELEYDDDGKMHFTPNEEFEKSLVVLVLDDINNVKGDKSSFGVGKMESDEINSSLNTLLLKYADMGVAVTAIKKTPYGNYGKYMPSVKEANGLSPNKCIVMFNPAQERLAKHGEFETLKFADDEGIQRLRFAYIAYNETGVSNLYLPLLFMPENGIFAELNASGTEKAAHYNEDLFNKHVEIRNTK